MLHVGDGADIVYAEEGSDTIYLSPDGERDEIYCGKANVDHDVVVYPRRDGPARRLPRHQQVVRGRHRPAVTPGPAHPVTVTVPV